MISLVNYTNYSLVLEGLQLINEAIPGGNTALVVAAGCASLVAYFYFSSEAPKNACVYTNSNLEFSPGSQEYKKAFKKAFTRLIEEKKIVCRNNDLVKKVRKQFFEKSNGCCFGKAACLLELINKFPTTSKIDLVKSVTLEDALYIQHHPCFVAGGPTNIALGSHIKKDDDDYWIPRDVGYESFIPWEENNMYIGSSIIKDEDLWVEFFEKNLTSHSILGRVDFEVDFSNGHTFSVWHTDNTYGFFDAASVHEFSDIAIFAKSVRNKILEYRKHYCKKAGLDDFMITCFSVKLCLKSQSL